MEDERNHRETETTERQTGRKGVLKITLGGGAVTGALEDAEIDAPGTDGFAVLVGHEAGELMKVGEVMDGPGGQELAESDRAEGGVAAAAVEIGRLEIQGAKLREAFGADGGKFVEKLRQRLALRFFVLAFAIKRLEGLRFGMLEDHGGAGNPIGVLGVEEVADDVEGGPGAGAFGGVSPELGEIAEEGVEGRGGAGE
jgi:hypothetical protein